MTDDILEQAAAQARSAPEPAWPAVSAGVEQRLRGIARRSRPLRAVTDTGAPIHVADQVLITRLRQRLAVLPGCELAQVRLAGDGDTCTGAAVDVVVTTYGPALRPLADQVRALVYDVCTDLLGPVDPPFGRDGVDVTVTDLAPVAPGTDG